MRVSSRVQERHSTRAAAHKHRTLSETTTRLINRDVDELHEKPNEAHHEEPNTRGEGNLLELCGTTPDNIGTSNSAETTNDSKSAWRFGLVCTLTTTG